MLCSIVIQPTIPPLSPVPINTVVQLGQKLKANRQMKKTALTKWDSPVLLSSEYAEWHCGKDYIFIIPAQKTC
jgi:hypothetical protein